MLREWAKRMILGTPWEGPLKHLHSAVTRSKNSRYDAQTIEIMRRVLHPGSVAIDIGAHQGGMLRHVLRFAPGSEHIAVEPIPELSESLRARFPRCRIVQAALADRVGIATFQHVTRAPALSGLKRRVDLSANEPVHEITVPVETLDHLVPPDLPIAFIKMDVEGGELGVFRGGRETLRRCRPVVVFESGLGGADSYGTKPAELFAAISEPGLALYLLDAWLRGSAPLDEGEFARQFNERLNYYFVAAPPLPSEP